MTEPSGVDTFVSRSVDDTEQIAARLAARLRKGDIICLSGGLGAGKTAFVRGLAAGLGIDAGEVSSPTFTLVHEYRGGRLRLFHADLYRLGRGGAADLGLEEFGQAGVLAIEWPDRLDRPIPGAIDVRLDVVDDATRRISVAGPYSIR